jgi:dihydroorotate dehydrogenase
MIYPLLRQALFKLDAETAHNLTLKLLQNTLRGKLGQAFNAQVPHNPTTVMGLDFKNPVGLSAGLDKNADYLDGLGNLGFGFIEVGTVTPRPQLGNPKPRMFRIEQKSAILNRMGFNNKGVDYLIEQVKQHRYKGILGINIGKNKDTPLESANSDYLNCLEKVYPYADYVAVNISSPNTPGLRDLQHGDMLDTLFSQLKLKQHELAELHNQYVPIAVKIAPDMSDDEIDAFAQTALQHKIDAVIATNTTNSREGVEGLKIAEQAGGLSGAPLTQKSTLVISRLGTTLAGSIPIIGVGGIMSPEDAQAKIDAGASLVQLFSGFVYKGPSLIKQISKQIQLQG